MGGGAEASRLGRGEKPKKEEFEGAEVKLPLERYEDHPSSTDSFTMSSAGWGESANDSVPKK